MSKKVISAKGEVVDFDLLKIKQKITDSPKSVDVVARERFIDKRRRRTSRKIDEMLAQQEESKRYAEDAMKLQQEQAQDNKIMQDAEVVPVQSEPVVNDSNTKEKFNRKIKR